MDKPQGVAEQADEGEEKLPTTPVIPQEKSKRKRFQLFEIDGYYRFRTDWLKNFHLGFQSDGAGGAPFPESLACLQDLEDVCDDTVKSANMRLRLEPTINVDETTKVYFQVDLLDNLVLGSTPDVLRASAGGSTNSVGGLTDGQTPPTTLEDAIAIRRAWAEIDTPLGHLTFGRQPWHWGLGIYANAGGADPFSGDYDLDSDFGDTVDRVMFRAEIPGTTLQAAVASDWVLTAPGADRVFTDVYDGQGWDLEDNDDVSQWVVMLSRFDDPKLFAERVARGETVFNYGGFLAYRTQDYASVIGDAGETTLVRRGLKTYTPDVWFKLGRDNITVELEGVVSFGSIENVSDIDLDRSPDATETFDESVDIRRIGAVARLGYRTLEDKMKLGLELGYASGDQWDHQQPGETHVRNARPLAIGGSGDSADSTIENFRFDPDFNVDLILFRQLLGTVTNATYVKPSLTYDLTSEISFAARAIVSIANVPVSTPGNSALYGVEFNGDLGYHKGGFFAGISYGLLFALGAMDHPLDGFEGGPGFGFDGNNGGSANGDPGNAQTIQGRLMLRF